METSPFLQTLSLFPGSQVAVPCESAVAACANISCHSWYPALARGQALLLGCLPGRVPLSFELTLWHPPGSRCSPAHRNQPGLPGASSRLPAERVSGKRSSCLVMFMLSVWSVNKTSYSRKSVPALPLE